MQAMTAVVSRKITGNETWAGTAHPPPNPANRGTPPVNPIVAGTSVTNARTAISSTGIHSNRSRERARRNPIPIPRKLASRMKLVKNVR